MKKKVNSAFTLVELIVVITILAILGTIAFISLQGYSSQSRDSVRISDMSRMKTGLELFQLDAGKYPIPTDGTEITYSGGIVWTQGYFGEATYNNVGKLDKIPLDPLTDKKYVYSTTNTRQEFQIAGVMEGDEVSFNQAQVNAGEKTALIKISGNYNGKLLKVSTGSKDYILAIPSLLTSSGETDIVNIVTNGELAYNGYKNLPYQYDGGKYNINGDAGISLMNASDLVVFSGSLKDLSSAETIGINLRKSLLVNLQNAYTGTTIKNVGAIARILSTDSEISNDTELLMSNIVSNNLGGSIISNSLNNTTNYTCDDTSKPTDNGHIAFTVGTPTSDNQTYVQDVSNCSYSCTDLYTGTSCETAPALITSTDCTNANWIWVASDVYIGSSQGSGFCISPRVGDFGDSTGNGISWNGWGSHVDGSYGGWDTTSVDDTGNSNSLYGQTKRLDSNGGYTCKSLGTSSTDFDTTDNIVGRMKWLATNKVNLIELQDIEWVQNATPANSHPTPALYIADCIDGVKDLGTDMAYKHYPNEGLNETITYSQYNTDVTLNTDTAYLSDTTYQNRQKYLTAWTQKTGSHLPSAMSYITTGYASASDVDGDFLTTTSRGEYQVACEASLLTDANDDTDNEWIWTSAIGGTTGTGWGRYARIVGSSGCGDQGSHGSGGRSGSRSARFVVRP